MAGGKVGSVECEAISFYLKNRRPGRMNPWPTDLRQKLNVNAGVFPDAEASFDAFCEVYIGALREIDLLAIWGNDGEATLVRACCDRAALSGLDWTEPWRTPDSWLRMLEGRRVLVVHPFVDTIWAQYPRRSEIWSSPNVLPTFDLQVLRMPLSPGIARPEEKDWCSRLDGLCARMRSLRFDVALIGAGAASLPLVAEARRCGAVGLHLGGATQLLFGIMGARWDESGTMAEFITPAWTRPSPHETPVARDKIEGGCYW